MGTICRRYSEAQELNPYIAEPHLMLSQLMFNRGAFAEAAHHAAAGLEQLYVATVCTERSKRHHR